MNPTNFTPINKTAARVLSRGEDYVPEKRIACAAAEIGRVMS